MPPEVVQKYRPFPPVPLPDRQWPNHTITQAPRWCSVDLRDGNQALEIPMRVEQKLEMFRLLVALGFKEIEVGFPAASQVEYDFIRQLIDEDLIPDDVTIQVLTQARAELIRRTCTAISGARRAIVHLYNSTSTLQRRVVFGLERAEIITLAVQGATLIKELAEAMPATTIRYEYTPESFTGTELDFALEICTAVLAVWQPTAARPVIINLPATVEMASPNVYADQIEWFIRHLPHREQVLISVHAHNDRGTAVAATELALLAGAERVEGTLFGNGERTGNVDLLTLALNLHTQGIDPGLDFHELDRVIEVCERCTALPVHPRHPYAGSLVYTAFSGSHQDAINKGLQAQRQGGATLWEVPYLPLDPTDVGRSYEAIIRINSQSGKGGAAYVLEAGYGFRLPRAMQPEFGRIVQSLSELSGRDVQPAAIWQAFTDEYLQRQEPYRLGAVQVWDRHGGTADALSLVTVEAEITRQGTSRTITGRGNGPLDAFCNGLRAAEALDFTLIGYSEHALTQGSAAEAVAYIQLEDHRHRTFFGAATDTDITIASLKAVLCGVNRWLTAG
ncbi:MAG: 2-isopropylmalate synthase [Desulfobulbaceae bacterium]|nr:2-isopropylmalate synthase [Desulfobulbaceae bacterium]